MKHSLEYILKPDAVAVIGASDTPGRIGGRPIFYSRENGFAGRIYPVNPNRDTVQGLPALASINAVPEQIDCAIVAVPAKIAVQTIADCAAAGVRSAVIFSSGFAELGDQGARAQTEIAEIARDTGMRVVGPNCLGVFNIALNWYGTFANAPAGIQTRGGNIGIVSQSGAYGSHVFLQAQQRGVASNFWVTTGNECDVDVASVIDYYAETEQVKVIVAYVESVKRGERFCAALDKARAARKPVILMKVGNSETGAQAALSHTASIVGSDDIYDAVFRQYGVHRAQTTQELADIAYACQFGRFPTGNRVCLQSISGGAGIQMADVSAEVGLDVTPLPDSTQKKLKQLIPQAGVLNPVDFTANALNNPELMEQNLRLTLTEGNFHSHVLFLTSVPASAFTRESTLAVCDRIRREFPDEVIVASMLVPRDVSSTYEAIGMPCFEDPAHAVSTLAALTRFGISFSRTQPGRLPMPAENAAAIPFERLDEMQAKRLLGDAGITVTRESLATTAEEAVQCWRELGTPVVLKISSADILHKTEIGGVLLNLNDADAIASGYSELLARAATHRPDATIDGVMVCEMIPDGVELIAGVTSDPVFGPAVMFGLGGIFVEVLKDVSFRLAPFDKAEARLMIDEIRGRPVLDGVRGAPACNVDALAETLAKLSQFAAAHAGQIESIDINPLVASGDRVIAADALIVMKDQTTT